MEDESTSYHEQAITLSEEVEEMKKEKIEVLQDLQEVSIKASSTLTPIPKLPRVEKRETIKVEKPRVFFSCYSSS
jgi:uncharacterized coiled-coil DUF342 family protein